MRALDVRKIIREERETATTSYFKHIFTGDIYEGPPTVLGNPNSLDLDSDSRVSLLNLTTLINDIFSLGGLELLERVKGIVLRKGTCRWVPLPDNPEELSQLEGRLFTYDRKTEEYVSLDIKGDLENVKAYEI